MEKRKSIIKHILSAGLICSLALIGSSTIANAVESAENQLNSILKIYGLESINIEDGQFLRIGEKMKLPTGSEWKLSTEGVVSIEDGQIKAIGTGTVFVTYKKDNKVHAIEIYVPETQERIKKYYSPADEGRDYYKVIVDAGHGGKDSGAPGFGKNESVISLEIAKKVEQKLKEKNIHVKMTREDDTYLKLEERTVKANNYGADAFVSIHLNSATPSARGIETYCHPNKQMYSPLAKEIQTHVISKTGAVNRGIKYDNLAVLRGSNMPSALLETGFISNKEEYNKLIDPSYQDRLATGVADGVEQYLKNTLILHTLPTIDTGVVINTDTLNVRSGYGVGYPKLGELKANEKVEIVAVGDYGWYKIKYKGAYGCVSGKYLRLASQGLADLNGHWSKDAVLDFVSKGYIDGYPDYTFRPENTITRAEFVKVVNKVFNYTDKAQINFTDVNSSQWYYEELCKAIQAGYIKGYEDNTFRPENPISREEASLMISRIKNNLKGDGTLGFADESQVSYWAKDAVDSLIDNGIVGLNDRNLFRPLDNITRAESVMALSRAENK